MKNTKLKYANYEQDKLWKETTTMTNIKKESDIVALNSKIDCLEALLAKSTHVSGSSQQSSTGATKPTKCGNNKIG